MGLDCVYELTKKSATSAPQPVSVAPDEAYSGATLLVDIPDPVIGHNDPWNLDVENANEAHIGLDGDTSGLWLATVPDLILPDNINPWEPDAGFLEELEKSGMGGDVPSLFQQPPSISRSPIDWFFSGPARSLFIDPTFSTPADCMFHTPYLVLRPMDVYPSLMSSRSPFVHAYFSNGSQIGRTFLLQNLKSYSTALARKNLPPFIHRTSLPFSEPSTHQTPTCAPPPPLPTLEICRSIIALYTTKTPATSSFVWRTITMEKDRFMNEYIDGDEWSVLSMLESITLFILLRIFDEDSFSVGFDRQLVRAMTVRLEILPLSTS